MIDNIVEPSIKKIFVNAFLRLLAIEKIDDKVFVVDSEFFENAAKISNVKGLGMDLYEQFTFGEFLDLDDGNIWIRLSKEGREQFERIDRGSR